MSSRERDEESQSENDLQQVQDMRYIPGRPLSSYVRNVLRGLSYNRYCKAYNLRYEPAITETYSDDAAPYIIAMAQDYAAAYPNYPHPYGNGLVRIWCQELGEFIDSAAFGKNLSLPDVWAQRTGIPMVMMLLTSMPGTYHASNYPHIPISEIAMDPVVGRWYDKKIITAFKGEPAYYTPGGDQPTNWLECAKAVDISREVLEYLDTAWGGSRSPIPYHLKDMVYSLRHPETDDFTWLTVDDMWTLRNLCRRRMIGTWTKLRKWLMRQKLTDDVRRALGGRPGRLLDNQKCKQSLRHSRKLRRVKTTRKGKSDA